MTIGVCALCGEPMPMGEQMFKYHGYSCPCPKLPLPKVAQPNPDHALIKQMGEALRAPKTLDGFTDTLKAIDAYNNWKRERGG